MLDELLELEIAYGILKTDDDRDRKRDPVDVHYEKLHAQLEVDLFCGRELDCFGFFFC